VKPKPDTLIATLTTPNGGTAQRCQAQNRQGKQCGRPARQDFTVCGSHGAGYAKREDAGERQPVGRPVVHGLYSKTPLKSLADLREEVAELAGDLSNTDGELINAKAVVWFLLGQAEAMNAKTAMLETALEAVERTLEEAVVIRDGEVGDGELTTAQARQIAAGLVAGSKLLGGIATWTDRLLEGNVKVIGAVKTRAEIRARMAEEQAVQHFVELTRQITQIIWTLAPDDAWLDVYEARLKRDIFGPLRLELPEPETST
jgi:hypothetical protein